MENNRFRGVFKKPHTFLPVIHVEDRVQAFENIVIARENGADGAFLISHTPSCVSAEDLISIHNKVRGQFPRFWIGINLLGLSPTEALELVLECTETNGIWTDDFGISGIRITEEATRFAKLKHVRKWAGLYFGGTAFKYQPEVRAVADLKHVTCWASQYTDVVTTSGDAIGTPPTVEKIRAMRKMLDFCGTNIEWASRRLAIASGMTPENVHEYVPYADCFLVSTGISKSFQELDPKRVRAFADVLEEQAAVLSVS